MAVERIQKDYLINLTDLVIGKVNTFKELRKDVQFRLESAFAERVISEDLNYTQQLAVRKTMIEAEKGKTFPDNIYISQIKKDVRDLRKLVKFQKVRFEYLDAWTDYKSGGVSIDAYITKLTSQLSLVTDDKLREELQKELSTARGDKRTAEISVISNKVAFALEDGSEDVLNSMLEKLQTTRAVESARGNTERVSFLDVQVASINKQLRESEIGRSEANLEFDALKGGANPVQKLKSLSNQISEASQNTPVTVGGVRYPSARDYWSIKRNAYLAGEGSGMFDDFFGELATRYENNINSTSNNNQFGRVPAVVIDNILNDYSSLEATPYMQPFAERLANNRNSVINFAVKLSAEAILNSAKARLNWDDVDASLVELEQRYAINLTSYRAQSAVDRGATEGGRVASAQNTARARLLQQGIDPGDAANFDLLVEEINKVLAEGGFEAPEKTPAEVTREELRTKPREEVAQRFERPEGFAEVFVDDTRFTGSAQEFESQFGFAPDDPRVSVVPEQEARERGLEFKTRIPDPVPTPTPTEREFLRPQNFAEVFVDGQHFAGTGAEFQSQFGFAPDDPRVKIISEEEARGRGLQFKTRIS